MSKVLGIINYDDNFENHELLSKRSLGAVSFLGRYRLIDFTLSNMTNSGINSVQICVRHNPRSIIEHVDSGVQYNVNSKRGKLYILFADQTKKSISNDTDISILKENLRLIQEGTHDYVVMAPSYMIYSIDYRKVIEEHEKTKADITMVYRKIDDADEYYINCQTLDVKGNGRIRRMGQNMGKHKERNVSLEAYVLSKSLFVELINKATEISALYNFRDIVKDQVEELKIHGYEYKGMVYCINSLNMLYRASMELIDYKKSREIIREDWPVYTQTNDSEPTTYGKDAHVRNSIVANGCIIEGTVENCVIGRDCEIGKGAVIRNSIIMADSVVSENTTINYAVIDKHAEIMKVKSIAGTKKNPAYIGRSEKV